MNIDELMIILNYLKLEVPKNFEIGEVRIEKINTSYMISMYEQWSLFHKETRVIKKYFTKEEIDYLTNKGDE